MSWLQGIAIGAGLLWQTIRDALRPAPPVRLNPPPPSHEARVVVEIEEARARMRKQAGR